MKASSVKVMAILQQTPEPDLWVRVTDDGSTLFGITGTGWTLLVGLLTFSVLVTQMVSLRIARKAEKARLGQVEDRKRQEYTFEHIQKLRSSTRDLAPHFRDVLNGQNQIPRGQLPKLISAQGNPAAGLHQRARELLDPIDEVLTAYEHLMVGIDNKIYDSPLVWALTGTRIKSDFDRAEPYVNQLRDTQPDVFKKALELKAEMHRLEKAQSSESR